MNKQVFGSLSSVRLKRWLDCQKSTMWRRFGTRKNLRITASYDPQLCDIGKNYPTWIRIYVNNVNHEMGRNDNETEVLSPSC